MIRDHSPYFNLIYRYINISLNFLKSQKIIQVFIEYIYQKSTVFLESINIFTDQWTKSQSVEGKTENKENIYVQEREPFRLC